MQGQAGAHNKGNGLLAALRVGLESTGGWKTDAITACSVSNPVHAALRDAGPDQHIAA